MSKFARCRLIRAIHRMLRQSAGLTVSRRRCVRRAGAVWKIFEFHRVVRLAIRSWKRHFERGNRQNLRNERINSARRSVWKRGGNTPPGIRSRLCRQTRTVRPALTAALLVAAPAVWGAGVDESGCDAERSYRACFAREAAEEENPFAGLAWPDKAKPAFADMDRDGDLDMFVGARDGTIRYYPNIGSVYKPVYGEAAWEENPLRSPPGEPNGRHRAFADMDNDGDLDLFFGTTDGMIRYYENTGGADNPVFSEHSGSDNPLDGVDVGLDSAPALADLDKDGDWDALIGADDGTLRYFENTGGTGNPVFRERIGPDNPLNEVDVGSDSTPALADLDNDGDWDVLIGVGGGKNSTLHYFENTGSVDNPVFSERFGPDNPWTGMDVEDYSSPALADLDNDGDWDALIGTKNGTLHYFENIGNTGNPVFNERFGSDNPLKDVDVGDYNSAPTLADLDKDGDWDALIGAEDGTLRYFENTGSAGNPLFSERFGPGSLRNGMDAGNNSSLALADLDKDGDWDALIGAEDGRLRYFENTGDPRNPVFSERPDSDNPLNRMDVGDN
ncbi:MAG: VCBS repeat-containing protein [Gammaproteobacteria bacterium]|nr:VCBS repeat-containing protein [Gammaproteobacteria bacterium]